MKRRFYVIFYLMSLKAQYVSFRRVFKANREPKASFDDVVAECGIMGVVVFIPAADAIMSMDVLMY